MTFFAFFKDFAFFFTLEMNDLRATDLRATEKKPGAVFPWLVNLSSCFNLGALWSETTPDLSLALVMLKKSDYDQSSHLGDIIHNETIISCQMPTCQMSRRSKNRPHYHRPMASPHVYICQFGKPCILGCHCSWIKLISASSGCMACSTFLL